MINKFGVEIKEIREIVRNKIVRHYISESLFSVLGALNIKSREKFVGEILELANSCKTLGEYEGKAYIVFENIDMLVRIDAKLDCRADIIYSQIQKHLIGNTLLDFGCGDGKVADRINKILGLNVTLTDVYKHKDIGCIGLEFALGKQDSVNLNKKFDIVLLLTVLHHADNPAKVLQEAKRLLNPNGKIIVIESIYGISDNSKIGKLKPEEQMMANIFFDHLYNRVFHYTEDPKNKVNLPYNHNTPDGWKKVFQSCGLVEKSVEFLGLDQPVCPEYHTLHILEVR